MSKDRNDSVADGIGVFLKEFIKQEEAVNHPQHYGGENNPYECIKVLKAWLTPEEYIGGLKFNIIKYIMRAQNKGVLEDYKKAQFYINELINTLHE